MNHYIIKLNRGINNYIRSELKFQGNGEVEFESAVLPNMVAIKTIMSKEEIEKFPFVLEVRESIVGQLC